MKTTLILLFVLMASLHMCESKRLNPNYVIIEPTIGNDYIENFREYWRPSNEEMLQFEEILLARIVEYQNSCNDHLTLNSKSILEYRLQLVCGITAENEKTIWVNGICDRGARDWKKEIIGIADGGDCYFNMLIDLSKKKCLQFNVNGNA